jgi:hypothetical protein
VTAGVRLSPVSVGPPEPLIFICGYAMIEYGQQLSGVEDRGASIEVTTMTRRRYAEWATRQATGAGHEVGAERHDERCDRDELNHQGVYHQGHMHAAGEDAGVYDQGHRRECECAQGVYHQGHRATSGPGAGVYHQGHEAVA